jgi:hypothetical protein
MSTPKQEQPGHQEYPGSRSLIEAADQPEVQDESLKVHGDKLEQGKQSDVKDVPSAPQRAK